MIRLEYAAGGELISDFNIKSFENLVLQKVANKSNMNWVVSNSNPIHLVRALVAEGKIPQEDVVFIFKGQELHPDKDGRISGWPKGFCDIDMDILERILNSMAEHLKG